MSYNTYPQNPFPPNSENAGGGVLPSDVITQDDIALPFNANSAYSAGDFCYYDNTLYRFDTDHSGAWDASDVFAVRVCDSIVSEFGDGLTRQGNEVSVKLKNNGKLEFDENGAIYTTAGGDSNIYNFNSDTPTKIGTVVIGQNVYDLMRVFATPTSVIFTPTAEEATANFLPSNIIPYPLDERAINIKFFAGNIDITNTFEFGRVGLNGSGYLQSFACHMANRVQITKIMVDYYLTTQKGR